MLSDMLASFAFSRPLWLLALLPCAAVCWWLFTTAGNRTGWDAIIPVHLRKWLIDSTGDRTDRGSYLLLASGWLLAVLILAGPSWQTQETRTTQSYAALFVVLDVSTNMLAGDLSPNRLERAKRKVHDILSRPDDRQLALIAYAGSAHRVTPLSDDDATLRNLLDALNPGIMPSPGQSAGAGLTLAREQADRLPRRSTQILLITSGVEGADLEDLEDHARDLGSQLAILGVGTAAGSPVALTEGGFMRDEQGRILLPRLDSQALAAIARRHGNSYHELTLDDTDLNRLLSSTTRSEPGDTTSATSWVDHGHWLLLLLLPLTAMGARKGWLGVLLIAAFLPPPAEAAWEDLWQRADQQAAELLERERPAEAAARFEDPAWKALARYRAEEHEAASEIYAELVLRDMDDPDSHYNYGTALAMAGRYNEALEAFEQALTRNPDHQAARHNRRLVEDWLKQQAQAEEEQGPGTDDSEMDTEPGQAGPRETAPEEQAEAGTSAPNETAPPEPLPDLQNGATTSGRPQSSQDPIDDLTEHADVSSAQRERAPERQDLERRQALEQWLEEIPDDPSELLRRKFLHQHLQQQDARR